MGHPLGISYDALHARWQRARCEDADGTGTTERQAACQAQGIYLQVLDSDGNAPAATGKKDCNNEL